MLSRIAQTHLEMVCYGRGWYCDLPAVSCILTDSIGVGEWLRGVDIELAFSARETMGSRMRRSPP
jgi:hypothetical protein